MNTWQNPSGVILAAAKVTNAQTQGSGHWLDC